MKYLKNLIVISYVKLVNLRVYNEKGACRQPNESQQFLMSNLYGSAIRIEHIIIEHSLVSVTRKT